MSDDALVDDGRVAGLNLDHMREQRVRLKLGIPLYDNKQDKSVGKMRPLTEEEQWRVNEYLRHPNAYPEHVETAADSSGGGEECFRLKTYGELSEAIANHRQHLDATFEDLRGRLGTGESRLVFEPGSTAERQWLSETAGRLKEELGRLQQEGRVVPGDELFESISRSLDTFTEYVQHRKAYLGLTVYVKVHFSTRESEKEKKAKVQEEQRQHLHKIVVGGMR